MSRIIDPYLREEVSANCLKKFGQIAYECLCTPSKDRPTMTMVLARLESVLTLAMQHVQTTSNLKHIAWSLFFTKVSTMRRVPHSGEAEATSLILKEFTYSELKTVTSNFHKNSFIGGGSFGYVYKGWLDRVTYTLQKAGYGLPVAIKILHPDGLQVFKELQAEVVFLGRFSHPNLVKLLGYCLGKKKLLLVYEYMQMESLEKHIFKKLEEALPWYTRIKIAIGAAQGLAFLHTPENNVIFRNVNTSKILLDKDFNAKLSDCRLARSGPANGESHVTTRISGTFGYAAPEYIATGQLYVKSDVYGFGVVMLEMITGLRVLDSSRHVTKQNLVDWAKPLLSDKKRIRGIMDPWLQYKYPSKAACIMAELIATCLEPDPQNRPSMEEIVSCLQGIYAIKMKPREIGQN